MSACEKCWHDAHYGSPFVNVADKYAKLLKERSNNPCTPEQQAGEDAGICPVCNRKTLHQWTQECMTGCPNKETV